ncbi:hypothetical protein Tsubulata_030361, partial [Turnera subulata]
EKVVIPLNKPCIFLEGAGTGIRGTTIESDDNGDNNPVFISHPDNIVAKGIAFKNNYSYPDNGIKAKDGIVLKQASAVQVEGDRCAFFKCAFHGIQDTLYDKSGRHYFKECFIEGSVDFIYGVAQSIYEKCIVSVNIGKFLPTLSGFITAQGKRAPQDTNDVIEPPAWDDWNRTVHEKDFTYVEAENYGPGVAAKRVGWVKNLTESELLKYVDVGYVDGDGWLAKLPNV